MPKHRFDPLPRRAPTPLEPVTVNLRSLPADAYVPFHSHEWAQLAYPIAGAMRLATARTTWIVPPSRALWISPRIQHELLALSDLELRTVYVDPSASPLPDDACEVLEVSALMRELIESLAQTGTAAEPSRQELVRRLFLDEVRRAPRLSLRVPMPEDRRLRTLCQELLAEPASALTLAQWSERVGASARTLARLFRQELGMSFGQWRQQMRLAQAAALISRGEALADVAAQLGYESASAFSAMFKRAFGRAPSGFFRRMP